ncbi:flagellin, partial [Nitrospina gracilis]
IVIQIGADSTVDSRFNLNFEMNLTAMSTTTLGIHDQSITSAALALTTLEAITTALETLSNARGRVGAVQNRLVRTINNLSVTIENVQAAESQIRDADIAQEIANLTRNQILVQASTAMVGQANLIPQSVLQLLQ